VRVLPIWQINPQTQRDISNMNNKVFVGNLPFTTTTEDLVVTLQDMGFTFHSAKVIMDRETGKSRGFAFVEFETPEAAVEAIKHLDSYILDGRTLIVAEARERNNRSSGGGGGEGGSGGGGGVGGSRNYHLNPQYGEGEEGGGRDRRGHRDRREMREGRYW
jgi:cold-inducible RNA-binding protein